MLEAYLSSLSHKIVAGHFRPATPETAEAIQSQFGSRVPPCFIMFVSFFLEGNQRNPTFGGTPCAIHVDLEVTIVCSANAVHFHPLAPMNRCYSVATRGKELKTQIVNEPWMQVADAV